MTLFRLFLKAAFRDWTTISWSLIFPLVVTGVTVSIVDEATNRARFLGTVILLSLVFFSASGTAFVVLSHRARGVYKLVRLSPTSTLQFVAIFGAARICVAMLSGLIVGVASVAALGVPLSMRAVLLTLPVAVGVVVAFTFVGILIGNLGKNEGQVAAINNLVSLPLLGLSTCFFSRSTLPDWLLPVVDGLPFEHALAALRAAIAADTALWLQQLPWLLVLGVLSLIASVATFRWEPGEAIG